MPLVSPDTTPTTAADEPERWPLLLRLWPVYPLFGFLALQFLLFIARKPQRDKTG